MIIGRRGLFLEKIGNPFTDVYSNLFEVKVSKVEQIDLVPEERNGSCRCFLAYQ